MSVTELRSNRMTEQDYDRARAELGNRKDSAAKWDQQLAALFIQSNWTQEQLAKKEGKPQSWVSRHTLFGRFLTFMPMGIIPKNITERKFRDYYGEADKAGGNERQRFGEVQKLMAADLALVADRRPKIGKPLVERFGDGKWHSLKIMAEALDTDEDHVEETLRVMRVHETYGATCESKKVGASSSYRIFRKKGMVSADVLTTKLGPIIDGLREEGKKHPAAASPGTVARLAHQLKQLLDEWTK